MRLLFMNLLRKPLRTGLTVASIAVALLLFCFLEAVLDAFNVGVNMASASRLVVQHKESLTFALPIAYRAALERAQGVKVAVPMVWFGGWYRPKDNTGELKEEMFAQFACDLKAHRGIFTEIKVPDEQFDALQADQQGCMLGDKTAERLGIRLGDRIVLRATIWSKPGNAPWEFNVRAIYTSDAPTFDRTVMFFHYKYFDEAREFGKGSVSIYWLGIEDPKRYQEIAAGIDHAYRNSPYETKTVTEKAFNLQFVSMMGNLQLLLRSIGSAVVLTMLLVSANTMMMSARDLTREMGILKALGFGDAYVFRLLIGESLLVAGLGACAGIGLAFFLVNVLGFNPKPDFFPVFRVPASALLSATGIAALTGFVSGLVPAVLGMRLKATEALRSV